MKSNLGAEIVAIKLNNDFTDKNVYELLEYNRR